ncbi:MAG: hypothetical protein ACAH83_05030 [Alphaproteobacteria bacterium]
MDLKETFFEATVLGKSPGLGHDMFTAIRRWEGLGADSLLA